MKQYLCRVVENEKLWGNVQRIRFDAPELALAMQPGQFALVRDPSSLDPYLRRTAWLYSSDRHNLTLTFAATDPIVDRTIAGDVLDVLAPLGHSVELPPAARHVLLVGQGAHIAPLVSIAHHAVKDGRAVVLAVIAQADGSIFPSHLLAPEIEYHTSERLDPELIRWSDIVIAGASEESYRSLSESVRNTRFRLEPGFMHVLADLTMPCGTGACHACAVETARGVRLACTDGPWFDWIELERRRMR